MQENHSQCGIDIYVDFCDFIHCCFASYALIMVRSGINPESHWFGAVSLTVADWTGWNHENVKNLAKLLGLLLYAVAGLAGGWGLLRRRKRKIEEIKNG